MRVMSVLCIACALTLGVVVRAAAQERILILDGGGGRQTAALLAVAPESGSVLARAALGGWPSALVRSRDGSRILVYETVGPTPAQSMLDRDMGGASSNSAGDHYLTVIEAPSLKVISRLWLGPATSPLNLDGTLFSDDGRRATLIVDKFKAPKKVMLVSRALVTIDLASGELAGWVALPKELGRGTPRLIGLPGGSQAVVIAAPARQNACRCWADVRFEAPKLAFVDLTGPAIVGQLALEGDFSWAQLSPDAAFLLVGLRSPPPKKNAVEAPSRIGFIDLATRQVAANVELSGVVALESHVATSPDRRLLYLLDAASGRLDIVSLDARSRAETLEVGADARFVMDADRTRVMVLSAGPAAVSGAPPPSGRLHVLKDAGVEVSVAVAGRPYHAWVAESGDRLDIVGAGGVTGLSWPGLERRSGPEVALSPRVVAVRVAGDGGRAFALDQDGQVAVIDTTAGRLLGSVRTSSADPSAATRWTQFALSSLANGILLAKNGPGPVLPARPPWEADPMLPIGVLAARPDGEFAYVFNPSTGTVTIIESDGARVAGTIAAAGQSLTPLQGGRLLVVDDAKALRVIDTTANKVTSELPVEGGSSSWSRFLVSPLPGGAAAVARGGSCYVIDGATGAVRSRVNGLKTILEIIVER